MTAADALLLALWCGFAAWIGRLLLQAHRARNRTLHGVEWSRLEPGELDDLALAALAFAAETIVRAEGLEPVRAATAKMRRDLYRRAMLVIESGGSIQQSLQVAIGGQLNALRSGATGLPSPEWRLAMARVHHAVRLIDRLRLQDLADFLTHNSSRSTAP